MNSLFKAVSAVSDAVWGPWTAFLLLATGLFLTVRFRFVQVTRLRIFPNLVGLIGLSGLVAGMLRDDRGNG